MREIKAVGWEEKGRKETIRAFSIDFISAFPLLNRWDICQEKKTRLSNASFDATLITIMSGLNCVICELSMPPVCRHIINISMLMKEVK